MEFFTRLLELRAVDLRELLARHALEPAGTKPVLAKIAAINISEEDLDDFLANRVKRPRTVEQRSGVDAARQGTLSEFAQRIAPGTRS